MNRRKINFLAAILVPILILSIMTIKPLLTIYTGKTILLETKPVDPVDLFRGDYVSLSYKAEEIPVSLVKDNVLKRVRKSDGEFTVYVVLKEKNGVHEPVSVTLHKPKKSIYLKGRLSYISGSENSKESVFVHYSLDRYFLQENTGRELEQASLKGNLIAEVKVRNGYAILRDIRIGTR
ncbi:GDYXXLXY domain-containing protein [Peribacillus sp. SCS-37]|uniref:GDYXXLXY domain-containing protein n=1 Tax=Paraperibacillus esterisolvens TaxID=3115296 RepID=UPI003905E025